MFIARLSPASKFFGTTTTITTTTTPYPWQQVMLTLDETFSNLDDIDYIVGMLHTTGKLHTAFPNYTSDLFLVGNQLQ